MSDIIECNQINSLFTSAAVIKHIFAGNLYHLNQYLLGSSIFRFTLWGLKFLKIAHAGNMYVYKRNWWKYGNMGIMRHHGQLEVKFHK